MTIDFERNAGGFENVDAEDTHNTNWQDDDVEVAHVVSYASDSVAAALFAQPHFGG